MPVWLTTLFDTSGFPPRWYCGQWSAALGWTTIISDILIFCAYVTIPISIAWVLRQRKDLPFPMILKLFAAFIFACGTVHLFEAVIFWKPLYRFSTLLKATTAGISIATVVVLIPSLPKLLFPFELEHKLLKSQKKEQELAERVSSHSQALDRTQSEVEAFFAHALDIMCTTSAEGMFTKVNPALTTTLGHSEETLLASSFISFVHPDDVNTTNEIFGRMLAGQQTIEFENRCRCADGSYKWLQWKSSALKNTGWVYACARDITQQKDLLEALASKNEELTRSNKSMSAFASALSHDLKAPLRAITSFSEVMKTSLGRGELDKAKEMSGLVSSRGLLMKRMIDDLLIYAKAHQRDELVKEVDLKEVCHEIEKMLDFPKEKKLILPDDFPTLKTLRAPLQQVLLNLISNANEHGNPQGFVELRWEESGEQYRIEVRDDGPGVDPKHYESIFELFRTSKTRGEGNGTGMGLAIVKRIVESFEGQVGVTSTEEGGAVFWFLWPKAVDGKSSDTTKHDTTKAQGAQKDV